MAKAKSGEKPGEKDGGEKHVEKPTVTPAKEEPEIIKVTPAPRGRLEGKVDGLIEKVDNLTQEIFGLGETPAEETRPVQAPATPVPGTEAKPDSGKVDSKDSGIKKGYPRLDFF